MATPSSITVTVVTPERFVLETEAESVVIPAADGEVGILPRHAPLVARLGAGELRINKKDSKTALYLEGGFAQVRNNNVSVLATLVKEISELKPEQLEAELAEVAARVPQSPADRREQTEKMIRLRSAIRIARRPKHHAAL